MQPTVPQTARLGIECSLEPRFQTVEHHSRRSLNLATLISAPTVMQAEGNVPKEIREFVGRANTGTAQGREPA